MIGGKYVHCIFCVGVYYYIYDALDSREWLHQKGNTLINEHSDVVELMSRLCGLNLTEAVSGKSHQHQIHHTSHTHETLAHSHPHLPQASVPVHVPEHYHGDFSTAIKDIADALIFDQLQVFSKIQCVYSYFHSFI